VTPDCLAAQNAALARDLTWSCALARYSGGLASFYVTYDEDTGELYYGLMREREANEEG
jgi:hypothetical protein